MNKKIISLFLLLILMVSITATYVYFNQNNETQYDSSDKTVDDTDVANEINDMFLEEDDEVEIGDII